MPTEVVLHSAAFACILLLGGDIELNPGPVAFHSCNEAVQNAAGKFSCGLCLGMLHSQCCYRIPDRTHTFCRSCFGSDSAKTIMASIPVKCSTQLSIKALNEKLDQILKKSSGSAVPPNKQQQTARTPAPPTPRTHRTPNSQPRKKLSYAEATQKESRNLTSCATSQKHAQKKPEHYRKVNTLATGTSRFTSLKATGVEIPPRVREKALCVSSLHKLTTDQDLMNHLRKVVADDVPMKIARLRSEHQKYYSSFHISVPPEAFDEIDDGSVWPVDVQDHTEENCKNTESSASKHQQRERHLRVENRQDPTKSR